MLTHFDPYPRKLEIDLSSQCGRGIFGVFKTVHGDLGRIRCSTGWFQAGNLQWQTYCIQLFGDRFAFGFTWLANCSIGRMTHRIDLVSTCFIHYWLARGIRVSEASICASQIYSFAEAVFEPHHWAQFNIFSLGAHIHDVEWVGAWDCIHEYHGMVVGCNHIFAHWHSLFIYIHISIGAEQAIPKFHLFLSSVVCTAAVFYPTMGLRRGLFGWGPAETQSMLKWAKKVS